jgi:serine/threonine protein kinase
VIPHQKEEMFSIGSLFASRYEILSEGKRGGMGAVYKVKDTRLRMTRALKVIHPQLLRSEQAQYRFRNEVSISLKLTHRNIVRVYDLSEHKEIEYFTMEHIEGKSLREIINERKKVNKPFTLEVVFPIISQLCEALSYAHQYTIHRDIKPENILIEMKDRGAVGLERETVKLTDFGIAKMLTPSQFMTTSLSMGTPYYMAPEQMEDAAHVDQRADIYAIGVILFELLTLENTIGPELPTDFNPSLSPEINDTYRKAVASKRENRFKQAQDLAANFSAVARQKKESTKEVMRTRSPEPKIDTPELSKNKKEGMYTVRGDGIEDKEESFIDRALASLYQRKDYRGIRITGDNVAARFKEWLGKHPHGNSYTNNKGIPASFFEEIKGQFVLQRERDVFFLSSVPEYSLTQGLERKNYICPVTGMEFVFVKGGTFEMGDTFEDGYDYEKPVHPVRVSDFYLAKYPINQGQWMKMMGSNSSDFKKGDNYPVETVSWVDVQEFIKKLNEKTGQYYRLPTEAEWEYAAREGGKKVRFGTGKDIITTDDANFNGSEQYVKPYSRPGVYRKETTPVGSFDPNALGLHDMSGNVWEWVHDWYDP